jgi:aldehyde dehydrogenase (NAD+)
MHDAMYDHDPLSIDGGWVDPAGSGVIDVISPFSEEVIARVPDGSPGDIDRAVAAARRSFDHGGWRWLDPVDRAKLLDEVADRLETRATEVAELITAEMGSTITFSTQNQVPGAIAALRAAAALGRVFPFEEERGDGTTRSLVIQEPVGVVAAIVPSNFPLLLAAAQIAPALVAGCSVVLKPAPESPLDTYVLAELFQEAGLPAGVLNIVPGGRHAGEHLVCHREVDKVAYTGSTAAGQRIAALCGERLTRVSLELGGKSAAVVLADAPLEETVAALAPLAFLNNGQACVAQTRILVPRGRHDELVDAFVAAIDDMTLGDPTDPSTQIGPLLAERQRDRVEGYLALGREEGATLVAGGRRPPAHDRGWFIEPTLFVDVDNSMRIAREEIFGPVVVVIDYDDPAEAVAIANDSDYGLSGSVWTGDERAGVDVARRIRTGMISINGAWQAPDAPFGGFKRSGLGRECGPEGLRLYLEPKAVGLPPAG